jgi:hypothetical protein
MKRIAKMQKVSYQDIKHTRLARAIRQGAYDLFCNDGNFVFLLEMIAQLPYNKRQEYSLMYQGSAHSVPERSASCASKERVAQDMPDLCWLWLVNKAQNVAIAHS